MKNILTGKLFIDAALLVVGAYVAITGDSITEKVVGGIVAACAAGDGAMTSKEMKEQNMF